MVQFLLIVFGLIVFVLVRRNAGERKWLDLPLYDDYISRYPHCLSASGVQCYHCHSEQIWEYGFDSLMDYRRESVCLICGTRLWRQEQESLSI